MAVGWGDYTMGSRRLEAVSGNSKPSLGHSKPLARTAPGAPLTAYSHGPGSQSPRDDAALWPPRFSGSKGATCRCGEPHVALPLISTPTCVTRAPCRHIEQADIAQAAYECNAARGRLRKAPGHCQATRGQQAGLKAVKRVDDPMVVAFRLQPFFELPLRRHQSVRAELELDE